VSRSYRKTPIISWKRASEKKDKKIWHRRFRSVNKIRVNQGLEPKHVKELSNLWDMHKDGCKSWFGNRKYGKCKTYWCHRQYTEEELKEDYKEYMRK